MIHHQLAGGVMVHRLRGHGFVDAFDPWVSIHRQPGTDHGFLNNFLSISQGSLAELEAQLLSASRLGYANVEAVLGRVNRVRALILGLRNHVRRKS